MNPLVILDIVRLSLELALEIVRSVPPEQRDAFWKEHQKNVAWWRDLFDKLSKDKP